MKLAVITDEISQSYDAFKVRRAAQCLMELAQCANVYFDLKRPWKDAKEELKKWEKVEDHYRKHLINLAGQTSSKGHGVTLSKIVRKGAIDWDTITKERKIDPEPYRKPPIEMFRWAENALLPLTTISLRPRSK